MSPFPKKSYRSIATTITAAFAAMSAVTLLVSGALGLSVGFQREKQRIAAAQQIIAQDAASTVRTFLHEKVSVLTTVADTTDPLAVSAAQRQLILDRLTANEPAFRHIVLTDTRGDMVAHTSSLSPSMELQVPILTKAGMLRDILAGKTHVSPTYISEETSEPFLIVAAPVTDAPGTVRGALFAELDLKFMRDLVGQIKVGEAGIAYVVDREGYLVAYGDVTRVLQHEQLTHMEGVQRFRSDTDGTGNPESITAIGINGTSVVTSYAPLGTPDWAVFVEVPFNEAYAPTFWLVVQILGTLVLSFILAVLLGRFIARRLTRPIGYLQRAVQGIREGKLDTEIVIVANDEIGVLGEDFAQMVVELKKSRAALLAKIEELEKLNKVMIGRELRMAELKEEAKKPQ